MPSVRSKSLVTEIWMILGLMMVLMMIMMVLMMIMMTKPYDYDDDTDDDNDHKNDSYTAAAAPGVGAAPDSCFLVLDSRPCFW